DVVDAVRGVGARVEALVSLAAARLNRPTQQQESYSPHRALPRYPVSLGVSIEAAKRLITANASNMSASGLFVRTGEEVEVGSVERPVLPTAAMNSPRFTFSPTLTSIRCRCP